MLKTTKAARDWYLRRTQRLSDLASLGEQTVVVPTAKFQHHRGITIGSYCRIGEACAIDGEGGVAIGDGTILAPEVLILSSSHLWDQAVWLPYGPDDVHKPVTIGRGVWLGWGAMICPGATVGDGAIVGMGAVVAGVVEVGSVVAGNPAVEVSGRNQSVTTIATLIENKKFLRKGFAEGVRRPGRPHENPNRWTV